MMHQQTPYLAILNAKATQSKLCHIYYTAAEEVEHASRYVVHVSKISIPA